MNTRATVALTALSLSLLAGAALGAGTLVKTGYIDQVGDVTINAMTPDGKFLAGSGEVARNETIPGGGTQSGLETNLFIYDPALQQYFVVPAAKDVGLIPEGTIDRFSSRGQAISADGNFVAGQMDVSDDRNAASPDDPNPAPTAKILRAVRYDKTLNVYTHILKYGTGGRSQANAISRDSKILAGYATGRNPAKLEISHAFKWDVSAGAGKKRLAWIGVPLTLPALANPNTQVETRVVANGISGDGRVVVGLARPQSGSGFPDRAFVSEGTITETNTADAIPTLPYYFLPTSAPGAYAEALAISGDGNTIVGYEDDTPMVWKRQGNTTTWTRTPVAIPAGSTSAQLTGVNFDGTVAVGSGTKIDLSPNAPKLFVTQGFRWTPAKGTVLMKDLLANVSTPSPTITESPVAVSDDGKIIAGYQFIQDNTGFYNEGWIAKITSEPSSGCNKADITDNAGTGGPDGQLTAQDVVTFFANFFGSCTAPASVPCNKADITDNAGTGGPDGNLTAQDVVTFFTSFFAGCPQG